jgi:TonB family protein
LKVAGLVVFVISCVFHALGQPRPKHIVIPSYPLTAWQLSLQGSVTIEVKLDSHGNVASVKASGADEILQNAAEENVRHWTFSEAAPGQRTLTLTYIYRILESKKGYYRSPGPATFDLPDRVEISTYPKD